MTNISQVAIVTCMDARIIPEKILGLEEGQAHIIRNVSYTASVERPVEGSSQRTGWRSHL